MSAPYDPYRQDQPGPRGGYVQRPPEQGYYRQQQPAQPSYQQQEATGHYYDPAAQQPYYVPDAPAQQPVRRKRRIFLWVFLVIQVIFIIWIIAGAASKGSGPSVASQVAKTCSNGGWQGLFQSHADCVKHYAVALNDATDTGKGIGIALIVVVWVVVDFFLGVGYGIYKLATR
jgi:hypothetical protein